MNKVTYITNCPQETKNLSEAFAQRINAGCIITLSGELASGKTTFTKGLGKGLDIIDTINSPTFTISKIYQGRLSLIHIDAYRLEGVDQDLGFEEFFDEEWVAVIEWPQFIEHLLPKNRIDVKFDIIRESQRKITFYYQDQAADLVKELL